MFTTRIAPSPTGMFHLGTGRTAYFNWLAAKASGGTFILRIDDTDVNRNDQAAVSVILDSLDWLGLDYDHVYYQSNRLDFYREAAQALVTSGKASIRDGAIILNPPYALPDNFPVTKLNSDGDLVIMRSNGDPTYNFASIYDDYIMGVDWIIRGHDHIDNTPKQYAIWSAGFKGDFPKTSHISLLFQNGKKLSKRDNAASLLWYRDQGYHPEAVLNFILRLGWSPVRDDKSTKIINKERAIEMFLQQGSLGLKDISHVELPRLDNLQANYERILKIPREDWLSTKRKEAA